MPTDTMIGRTFGAYRVLSPLGEGGMATVWLAVEKGLERNVALKVLKPTLSGDETIRRRFLAEARNAALLNHPSIATVLAAGLEGSELYISYRLVEGRTISEIVARAPLSIAEVVRIGLDVASALALAHGRGIVHRDISGRNIMLDRHGRAIVLDFGLSQAEWASSLTTRGVRVGTPGYMAPELAGEQRADARADLFGLGVVLFEALTGRRPFEGARPEIVAFAIVSLPPPSPRALRPETPEALEAVILRLLAKQPDERYETAEALIEDLRALESSRPAGEGPSAPLARAWEVAPPTPGRYLGVVPFETEAGDARELPELADVVGSAVARDGDVRVIPAAAMRRIPPTQDLRELARRAGATVLLRGSVRASGPRLRATLSLVDPFADLELDAETVDGTRAQRFEFEDAVTAAARRMLRHVTEPVRPRSGSAPVEEDRLRQANACLLREESEVMVDGAIDILERLERASIPDHRVEAALARAYLAKFRLTWTASWESKAAAACEAAHALCPESGHVHVARGLLFLTAGRYAEAHTTFARAIEAGEETYQARIGLGLAEEGLDHFGAAAAAFKAAIEEKPDAWLAYKHLGLVYFREGRYEDALTPWRRALELTPDNAQVHGNLAGALFFLDRFDEAIDAFRRSIELLPRALSYTNLGTALFYTGRDEEAAEAFSRATSLNPADPRAWGNLGSASLRVPGREREGHEALRHAIGLLREHLVANPSDAEAWGLLGSWLGNLGHAAEAREAIDRAVSLAPDDVAIMARAGTVRWQAGAHDDAVRWLRNAVEHGYSVYRLIKDPYLAGLEAHPAFASIRDGTPKQGRG